MKTTIFILLGLVINIINLHSQTVTDYDGNVYNTVTIGNQVWMKENLKVIHYNNGTEIPKATSFSNGIWFSNGALCYYNNDSTSYYDLYGPLYNWLAVNNSQKVCPLGWHVPTQSEWFILSDYLGGGNIAGGKLKETDTIHWHSPNTSADNSSGFTALPGGLLNSYSHNGQFQYVGEMGHFWSSTLVCSTTIWFALLSAFNSRLEIPSYGDECGFSIRCIKDSIININSTNIENIFNIYPNPAFDRIYINNNKIFDFKIQVFDIVGECILEKELNNITNEIDICSFSKGIYIIQLTGNNWTFQHKLTKE